MQRGRIYRNGRFWVVRYYETVLENGKEVKRRVARKLAPIDDQHRSVGTVRGLAEKILAPINAETAPESVDTVVSFLENVYLPYCDSAMQPSTARGYRHQFNAVKPYLGGMVLRSARTPDIEKVLRAFADAKPRGQRSLHNARNFLSGGFRYAKRLGAIDQNPVRDCVTPKGKPAKDTHAYTVDEIQAMLAVLDEPARTCVLVAALTGLRKAEIQGLRWTDFKDGELKVNRAVWNGIITETKTHSSRAGIPLLPLVQEALEEHKARNRGDGFVFHTSSDTPLALANVARRDIVPAMKKAGLEWHGWHAFRRGLATNLYALGAPDKTVQAILRHANVATTMAYYVKPVASESHAAMRRMESAFKSAGAARKRA